VARDTSGARASRAMATRRVEFIGWERTIRAPGVEGQDVWAAALACRTRSTSSRGGVIAGFFAVRSSFEAPACCPTYVHIV
jgi:hypothetical protein